jgi:uncharacterized protein (UPF0332 family)
MSPRSAEFLEAARRRLSTAATVARDDPSVALSAAYYAMLYAIRAALSERDVHAKTHRGSWREFRHVFVETGEFDGDLVAAGHKVQSEREESDYNAWPVPAEEAQRVVELARTFVAAIEEMLAR